MAPRGSPVLSAPTRDVEEWLRRSLGLPGRRLERILAQDLLDAGDGGAVALLPKVVPGTSLRRVATEPPQLVVPGRPQA